MSTTGDRPVLGAALNVASLETYRSWILERQRDLELQDFFTAEVLNGDWRPLADRIRTMLDGYKGRLGIHGPFWGFKIDSQDPTCARSCASASSRASTSAPPSARRRW
jgi:hypothetical protein